MAAIIKRVVMAKMLPEQLEPILHCIHTVQILGRQLLLGFSGATALSVKWKL
jgi:hypothetical protein